MDAGGLVGDGVPPELAALLRGSSEGPTQIVPSVCGACGGRTFFVLIDDVEGAVERECSACGSREFVADSNESWDDADPGAASCPCGGEEFEMAVAFSLTADGSVRWVTVGLRCYQDGTPGVFADWKIDYLPADHLLTRA